MKEINYDEVLAPPKLKIIVGGEKYEVEQPTLQKIIDFEQRINDLFEAGKNNSSVTEIGNLWIEIILSVFCNIPREELTSMTMPKLRKMFADCKQCVSDSMWPDSEEVKNEGDKKKKKNKQV